MVTEAESRRDFVGQATRFVAVGIIGALIDSGVYALALHLDVWVHAARALSFASGTAAAYALNRRWAFRVSGGSRRASSYAALYGVMFFVILGANALALAVLPVAWWSIPLAWVLSQGFGTTCNFVMLRTVVFRDR